MSNYVKLTDFASKDALTTGNPLKLIKGTEINDEYNAIQTAIGTKADLASPAFLGNPTAPTQTTGNNTTRIATTQFVQQELDAAQAAVNITGGTIDGVAITGGTVIGLATDLAVADGGTGASTLAANAVLLGNGTSAVQTVAPGSSGNLLTSNGTTWESNPNTSLGIGQTYTDVTGSRLVGTTYTNSTGKAIIVFLTYTGAELDVTINGTLIYSDQSAVSGGTITGTSFIVTNGSTYVVTGATVSRWVELR